MPLPSPEDLRGAVARRADGATGLLADLVRVPSLPGAEAPALDLVAAAYADLGAEVRRLPVEVADLLGHPAFVDHGHVPDGTEVVLATFPGAGGGTGGRSLLLNAHVDVVPTGPLSRWRSDPFSGDVHDGRLHGRGSCDTKAGLVAAVLALRALADLGVAPVGDVLLQAVTGEETGGAGTLTAVLDGHLADAAVVLEPTSLRACPVQSGSLSAHLVVHGRGSHGSTAHAGVSALDVFDDVRARLRVWQEARTRVVPDDVAALYAGADDDGRHAVAPLSWGRVAAGDWPSSVPERLVAEGRVGIPPRVEADDVRRGLAAEVAAATASAPLPAQLSETEPVFEAGWTDPDHPVVRALQGATAAVTGADLPVRGVPYGCDLRLLTRYGGVPSVVFGPGDVADAHAVDESVELAQVSDAAAVLARLVLDWCGASV